MQNTSLTVYSVPVYTLNIFTLFSSCSQHITLHYLRLLALWYWCNMHKKLLPFKKLSLSQRFWIISVLEIKSTAASWNVNLSCLFSYQNVTANKQIGNMYFIFFLWHDLKAFNTRLRYDMLYSTVWPGA